MSSNAHRGSRYRARVAPRRGGSRGPATRIRWDKVGRVALVLVLFAVLASYINPVVNLVDNWRDSRTSAGQLTELKRENAKLERRAAELQTPLAAIREARRLGLVGEGERAYAVRKLDE